MSTAGTCRVRVCRDCCCGTARKHPDVDHDGLLGRLVEGLGDAGRVDVSRCLLACERSNVVVVTPSAAGRRRGGRAVWLARVFEERVVDAIVGWVRAGGPGVADLPPGLAARSGRGPVLTR